MIDWNLEKLRDVATNTIRVVTGNSIADNKIPVDEIKSCFHAQLGRPTKEIRTMLGVLVLQQMFDLTDHEAIRQLAFNTEWHYALKLCLEDDESKYLCERTLRTYRSLVTGREIDTLLFQLLTDTLLDKLNISTKNTMPSD